MGPKFGTPEYNEQVITITTALQNLPFELLPTGLMMYILDESYSRPAICRAEKILRKRFDNLQEIKDG